MDISEALEPPFFRLTDPSIIEDWLRLGLRLPSHRGHAITLVERELFTAWKELSEKGALGEVVDIVAMAREANQLANKQRHCRTFSVSAADRLRYMTHAGIVSRTSARELGRPRAMLYELRSPQQLANIWVGGPRDSQAGDSAMRRSRGLPYAQDLALQDAVETTYSNLIKHGLMASENERHGSDEPWTLSLISQLIERCSRSSSRQQIDSLKAVIRIGNDPVRVEARRIHYGKDGAFSHGLIAAEDAQLILAIITTAMRAIEKSHVEGVSPQNHIEFDLLEVSQALCPDEGARGYQALQRGMARIMNTEFFLTPQGANVSQRARFRIVESPTERWEGNAESVSAWQSGGNLRFCSFRLNEHLWQGLLEGQGWLVPDQLLFEREGLIHKLYHHLRLHAGIDESYEISSNELMPLLNISTDANPSLSRKRFGKRLWQVLRDHARRVNFTLGLPERLADDVELSLFDVRLIVRPSHDQPNAIVLLARHSEETLALLARQEERNEELRRRSGTTYANASGITSLTLHD